MNCPACKEPMMDGQPMNGLLKCHWDCSDTTRRIMGEKNAQDFIRFRCHERLMKEGIEEGSELYKRLMGGVK